MHMPLHRQGRGDDLPTHNHRLLPQSEAGDSLNQGALVVRRIGCRRTHSQDSPSGIHGIRLSDNLHQRVCYEQRVVNPLLEVQSAPILLEILVHRRCLHD